MAFDVGPPWAFIFFHFLSVTGRKMGLDVGPPWAFIFFHSISFSLIFFHFLSFYFFIFFHFLSFSFMFFHVLSFSFIFFHFLLFSFIFFVFVGCSKSDFFWASISLRFLLTVLPKKAKISSCLSLVPFVARATGWGGPLGLKTWVVLPCVFRSPCLGPTTTTKAGGTSKMNQCKSLTLCRC